MNAPRHLPSQPSKKTKCANCILFSFHKCPKLLNNFTWFQSLDFVSRLGWVLYLLKWEFLEWLYGMPYQFSLTIWWACVCICTNSQTSKVWMYSLMEGKKLNYKDRSSFSTLLVLLLRANPYKRRCRSAPPAEPWQTSWACTIATTVVLVQ